MSMIPGEVPHFGTAEILIYTSGNAPGAAAVVVSGNLVLDAASAAWGLLANTVLGRETATGYYKPCVRTATDGSEVPVAILHRNIGADFDTPRAAGDVIPTSIQIHGSIHPNGLSDAHIDVSWGTTVADRVTAMTAELRKVGIYIASPGLWSWNDRQETTPAGATALDGAQIGLVEVIIQQGFGSSPSQSKPLVSIVDRSTGSIIQPPNGYRLLVDRRSAKSLVDAGAATYV